MNLLKAIGLAILLHGCSSEEEAKEAVSTAKNQLKSGDIPAAVTALVSLSWQYLKNIVVNSG